MPADSLTLTDVGPIQAANIEFGDLTVLVGPQATGKSIFLQCLKLLLDRHVIFKTFDTYGVNWSHRRADFFDPFFGEGMRGIWSSQSSLAWNGRNIGLGKWSSTGRAATGEKCFFIPAQRVLTLTRDGWLRPFADYNLGDPYVVRDFSGKLRVLTEASLGRGPTIFPARNRLNPEVRRLLGEAVFSGFNLKVVNTIRRSALFLRTRTTAKRACRLWSGRQGNGSQCRSFSGFVGWLRPTSSAVVVSNGS